MPDQLWDSLKQIFHAAVALPPGARPTYLDKACEGDLSLRAAVEALIKSHEDTTNFVDAPAYQAAAEMLAGNHEFESGHTIAHYQIRSVLGEGGMGKVYLAHDTKLDRKVALKILPLELAANQESMRRFTQEAKTAAALHHPDHGNCDTRNERPLELEDGDVVHGDHIESRGTTSEYHRSSAPCEQAPHMPSRSPTSDE